jgi:hypothetical protein
LEKAVAPPLHPFLDLEETDRTRWLAALFDAPATPPPYGVRYPVLRAGESPYSWLRDQFQKAEPVRGARDRIRRSVVEILRTGAARESVRDRAQVLGQLLEVAGACGFQEDLEATLQGWVRDDAYAGASYRLGGQRVPLRRTVWAVLIAWHATDALVPFLHRDLSSRAEGSELLCFVELGRLAPDDAIRRIPGILDAPEPYWREALHGFLSLRRARETLAGGHAEAWTECLADIHFDRGKLDLLTGDRAPLQEVLLEAGIFYDRHSGPFGTLSAVRDPKTHIEIDPGPVEKVWDDELTIFINQALSFGTTAAAALALA